jgi:GWxTD domain-containing protein
VRPTLRSSVRRPLPASSRRRRYGALALPLAALWLVTCRSAGEPEAQIAAEASALTDGPLRWLMLPEEQRQARRLRTAPEAADFLEAFWRRRAAPGARPGDAARLFYERVEAADRLYFEEGSRGSLTDRGRALILLGPPPVLRYGQRRVPAWEPSRPGSQPAIHTRPLAAETWVYPLAELPPALAALLTEQGAAEAATLVFLIDRSDTHLIAGKRVLELAVLASVHPVRR